MVASRQCSFHRAGNLRFVRTEDRPDVGTENNQSELSIRQILLILDILIARYQHAERGFFRSFQEVAVFELRRPF